MTRNEQITLLKALLDEYRFQHCLAVEKTASELALRFGDDSDRAAQAGLLHDCAKQLPPADMIRAAHRFRIPVDDLQRRNPGILHGSVGACMAREDFHVNDKDVLHAISVHVTGAQLTQMNLLDKILYIADYIEPGRTFPGVDHLRETVYVRGLDAAIAEGLTMTMQDILRRGKVLHPATVKAYNSFIIGKEFPK